MRLNAVERVKCAIGFSMGLDILVAKRDASKELQTLLQEVRKKSMVAHKLWALPTAGVAKIEKAVGRLEKEAIKEVKATQVYASFCIAILGDCITALQKHKAKPHKIAALDGVLNAVEDVIDYFGEEENEEHNVDVLRIYYCWEKITGGG